MTEMKFTKTTAGFPPSETDVGSSVSGISQGDVEDLRKLVRNFRPDDRTPKEERTQSMFDAVRDLLSSPDVLNGLGIAVPDDPLERAKLVMSLAPEARAAAEPSVLDEVYREVHGDDADE